MALLRCDGRPGCFDGSLQVVGIVGSGVSLFSLLTKADGVRSGEFAGQSSTVTPWLLQPDVHSGPLPPDSGTLIPKSNANLTVICKDDFGLAQDCVNY